MMNNTNNGTANTQTTGTADKEAAAAGAVANTIDAVTLAGLYELTVLAKQLPLCTLCHGETDRAMPLLITPCGHLAHYACYNDYTALDAAYYCAHAAHGMRPLAVYDHWMFDIELQTEDGCEHPFGSVGNPQLNDIATQWLKQQHHARGINERQIISDAAYALATPRMSLQTAQAWAERERKALPPVSLRALPEIRRITMFPKPPAPHRNAFLQLARDMEIDFGGDTLTDEEMLLRDLRMGMRMARAVLIARMIAHCRRGLGLDTSIAEVRDVAATRAEYRAAHMRIRGCKAPSRILYIENTV
jgi:hypothetical protein